MWRMPKISVWCFPTGEKYFAGTGNIWWGRFDWCSNYCLN